MKFALHLRLAVAAALVFAPLAAGAATLDDVKAQGIVKCGVAPLREGFSINDGQGNWSGLDADFCRAIAAAVFDDPKAVLFRDYSTAERFPALNAGDVDLLARTTTWTMSRDTAQGFNFRAINYFDGQGFLVNRKKQPDITSVLQLSGAKVCVLEQTTSLQNLQDYFAANKMQVEPVIFKKLDELLAAYDQGTRCDAYTTDQSGLYSARINLSAPEDHVVLPEVISKEPLGPVVRQGDEQWFDIVTWVHYAMLTAEELGVTSTNIEEMQNSTNPDIRRLLGLGDSAELGEKLGLSGDWAARIIRHVGNYGEVFERNVGEQSRLKIMRGLNALWTKGGLQYAPPLR